MFNPGGTPRIEQVPDALELLLEVLGLEVVEVAADVTLRFFIVGSAAA